MKIYLRYEKTVYKITNCYLLLMVISNVSNCFISKNKLVKTSSNIKRQLEQVVQVQSENWKISFLLYFLSQDAVQTARNTIAIAVAQHFSWSHCQQMAT